MRQGYAWYRLRPYEAAATEQYDDSKDKDLLMLCRAIPDVVFCIFHLPSSGMTLCLRIPDSYTSNVESVSSFGAERMEFPPMTRIDALVALKLGKSFAYPLHVSTTEGDEQNIHSAMAEAPHGVFVIKLRHVPSRRLSSKFRSLARRNEKRSESGGAIDLHEKDARRKAEAESFFAAEILVGTKTLSDIQRLCNAVPYTAEREPNRLVTGKVVSARAKNLDLATTRLQKAVREPCKNSNNILADYELAPIVRFPEDGLTAQMGHADPTTTSSAALSEHAFDHLTIEGGMPGHDNTGAGNDTADGTADAADESGDVDDGAKVREQAEGGDDDTDSPGQAREDCDTEGQESDDDNDAGSPRQEDSNVVDGPEEGDDTQTQNAGSDGGDGEDGDRTGMDAYADVYHQMEGGGR